MTRPRAAANTAGTRGIEGMTGDTHIEGRCLCGAVTVSADLASGDLTACSCDMCRRHTSSVFIAIAAVPGSVTVEGPAQSFRSSDWAERGFCGTCGSTLWYGTQADGAKHLAAGLFDNAAGGRVAIEFFADRRPEGHRLDGDHRRLSTEETIAMFSGARE